MEQGVFITATDTEVGKTVVSAGIAGALKSKGLNVGVMKPVATGVIKTKAGLRSNDVGFLMKSIESRDDPELVNPIRFELPLAPLSVLMISKIDISLDKIKTKIKSAFVKLCSRHDFVVVEGIGGILVPIKQDYLVADMIKDLNLPVVVVARPGLGTINHTLLTIRAAQNNNIEVKGFIINKMDEQKTGDAEKTNPLIIQKLSRRPLLGILPFDPAVKADPLVMGNIIDSTLKHIETDKLFK